MQGDGEIVAYKGILKKKRMNIGTLKAWMIIRSIRLSKQRMLQSNAQNMLSFMRSFKKIKSQIRCCLRIQNKVVTNTNLRMMVISEEEKIIEF